MQAHKIAASVRIFNRNGQDCSARYPRIRDAVAAMQYGHYVGRD